MSMDTGAITLGKLHERGIERLALACDRCRRQGSYRVARLVEIHGAPMGLPDLRGRLTAGCEAQADKGGTARCGARYPELPGLFTAEKGEGA